MTMSKEDQDLAEIFSGEERLLHPDTVHITLGQPKEQKKPKDIPVQAQWQPVKPEPNWLDKLKNASAWCLLFGGLSCLVFYWQSAGLMAESIAVPCIAVCTALGGWGCGKNVGR